jgi:hypothetical protein
MEEQNQVKKHYLICQHVQRQKRIDDVKTNFTLPYRECDSENHTLWMM